MVNLEIVTATTFIFGALVKNVASMRRVNLFKYVAPVEVNTATTE